MNKEVKISNKNIKEQAPCTNWHKVLKLLTWPWLLLLQAGFKMIIIRIAAYNHVSFFYPKVLKFHYK